MRWKLAPIGAYLLVLVFAASGANRAFGQECPVASSIGPTIASQVRTLEGRLVFHNGIRQWFELKLDKIQCGQRSILLVQFNHKLNTLAALRDCRVVSTGAIDFSPTGYYSLDIFQDVKQVRTIGTCLRKPPFPDYSRVKPDKLVRTYTVDMHVVYEPGDHPIIFHVRSAGKELRPWQAYASYMLTGGFVLYGLCGDGFVIDKVFGTPAAHPGHFDDPRTSSDMAAFDPESAEQLGEADLHLGYTCIRAPPQERLYPVFKEVGPRTPSAVEAAKIDIGIRDVRPTVFRVVIACFPQSDSVSTGMSKCNTSRRVPSVP